MKKLRVTKSGLLGNDGRDTKIGTVLTVQSPTPGLMKFCEEIATDEGKELAVNPAPKAPEPAAEPEADPAPKAPAKKRGRPAKAVTT